jgi:DNA-nicking Smr family endonuclease
VARRRKVPVVPPDPVRTLHGSIAVETLDLHGLRAEAAERRVRGFLEAWSRREPGAVVRIVTGKGARSEGAPVLRTLVLELLTGALAAQVEDWAGEVGGGAYLVRVR